MGGGNSGRNWSGMSKSRSKRVRSRWEFGEELVGDVEVEVEARQVAVLLLVHLIDFEFREDHSAFRMVRVREGKEAGREDVASFDLVGSQFRQLVPGHSRSEFDAHALLDRLAARHGDAGRGIVA